jgi:deoxyribodipyrimidine photo-lyase
MLHVFWFRRDLRLHDNAGLYHALRSGKSVLPIFIFDRDILEKLPPDDRRLRFIHQALGEVQAQLQGLGSTLHSWHGQPLEVFRQLTEQFPISAVYTNHDYEPYAQQRDNQIRDFLAGQGIAFHTFKDQAIFEKSEVLSGSGTPYTVFTPYARKWKETCRDFYLKSYPTERYFGNFYAQESRAIIPLEAMGFRAATEDFPSPEVRDELIRQYAERRDLPSVPGTSRLSVHLRFGTISIRDLARRAKGLSEGFLNELIWRDFYFQILHHFPHVGQGKAFRAEYDRMEWRNNEAEFAAWCAGQTGYPLVDAGMRELNATGFMHNRVRMVVASFLTKHLLIDWRWGEQYFAEKLLDFDLSANNGGWQWAAGSGCDAAPYFRVFNPRLQTEKFDKQLLYIKRWIPELNSLSYPAPIVEHDWARKRVLAAYQKALGK